MGWLACSGSDDPVVRYSGRLGLLRYLLGAMGREAALESAREEARERAIAAGADRETISIMQVEEIPLAYLPGAVRVNVKAVGDLAALEPAPTEEAV